MRNRPSAAISPSSPNFYQPTLSPHFVAEKESDDDHRAERVAKSGGEGHKFGFHTRSRVICRSNDYLPQLPVPYWAKTRSCIRR
jgi:hypothetical protein